MRLAAIVGLLVLERLSGSRTNGGMVDFYLVDGVLHMEDARGKVRTLSFLADGGFSLVFVDPETDEVITLSADPAKEHLAGAVSPSLPELRSIGYSDELHDFRDINVYVSPFYAPAPPRLYLPGGRAISSLESTEWPLYRPPVAGEPLDDVLLAVMDLGPHPYYDLRWDLKEDNFGTDREGRLVGLDPIWAPDAPVGSDDILDRLPDFSTFGGWELRKLMARKLRGSR